MSGDDEDFKYQSQIDTVLDADTYGDFGSISTMVTDQCADQTPGDSVVSERNHLQVEDLNVQRIAPPTENSLL
jgi:hypothetical protein